MALFLSRVVSIVFCPVMCYACVLMCYSYTLVISHSLYLFLPGLRSVRYFKEVPGIRQIVANDLDPKAVESIARNLRFNGIEPGPTTVLPNLGMCVGVCCDV